MLKVHINITHVLYKMKLRSAPNEQELNDKGPIFIKLKEFTSQDTEDFATVIKRDLNSLKTNTLDKDHIKSDKELDHTSSELITRPSLAKDSLKSTVFTQSPQFNGDSMKSQEERKSMYLNSTDSIFVVTNRQDNETLVQECGDLNDSPGRSIKGLMNKSRQTIYAKTAASESPLTKYSSPCTKFAAKSSFMDEAVFKDQANFAKHISLFNRRGGKTSSWKRLSNTYDQKVKGFEYYKEVLDKNSERMKDVDESMFSYSPDILPMSKKRKPLTPYEMSYQPIQRKQDKIKAMRKEIMKKANKEFTFAPGLTMDAYSKIDSKLKLKNEINTYLERIHKNNQEKLRQQKVYKEVRAIEELIECTHKPKINKRITKYKK